MIRFENPPNWMSMLREVEGVEQADHLAPRSIRGPRRRCVTAARRGKFYGLPLADVSNSAPFFTCQACRAVKRAGSTRLPAAWRPATAPRSPGCSSGRAHGGAGVGDALALGPHGDRQAVDVAWPGR